MSHEDTTPHSSPTPCCEPSSGPDRPSAVEFATTMRVHVALATRDLPAATRFYADLFGQPPTKEREGYAKFEVAEPPVNLTLNAVTGDAPAAPRTPYHFGIQVKSTKAVAQLSERMRARGNAGREEAQVACCYAIQDKVWFHDPDGHAWEVFVVTEADSPILHEPSQVSDPDRDTAPCCEPTCCR
jgi:catechol 2,3-dioxygenase-like lactoylglutathione lyase family enzyme